MNKLTIPAILVATVMVAGIFAFMPVQQASTVHTTFLLPATTGIACATEAVDIGAEIDDDILTFTFTSPILLMSVLFDGDANMAGDTLGFDAVTIDGADAIALMQNFAEALDDTPDLNWNNEGPFFSQPIYVGATLAMVADDDDGNALGANDDFTVTFCGIVEDAGNFDGNDVALVITEG